MLILISHVTVSRIVETRGYHFPEIAYVPRSHMHLRDLPANHLKRVKEVPFAFHEYRVSLC